MMVKRCLNCGTPILDIKGKLFCCTRCSKTYRQRKYRAGELMPSADECLLNEGVICKEHNCDSCGWNPKVSRKRLETIRGRQ